jgi:16S rRNA (guanine527-N7)-methyltransferase
VPAAITYQDGAPSGDLLREGLAVFGVSPADAPGMAEKLARHVEEVLLHNRVFDLTAARTGEDLIRAHVFDSLAGLPVVRELAAVCGSAGAPVCIADIGSGAGFPGIPLALAMPDRQFILVERRGKRADFLTGCAAILGMDNVRVEKCDADQLEKRGFDILVFRALTTLDRRSLRMLLALIKPGGFIAAYKARPEKIAAEMAALPGAYEVRPLQNPFLPDHQRHLVIIPAARGEKKPESTILMRSRHFLPVGRNGLTRQ